MSEELLALSPAQRADYERFKQRIRRRCGVDLSLYKPQQMHRRLWGLVERLSLHSFTEYADRVDTDPAEWARFLDRMTINVSELFRNPEKWTDLHTRVLPSLMTKGKPMRIWSAGCSYGAEPFSLAMLLNDLAPGLNHYLLATDIDEKILAKAREGYFTDADIRGVPVGFKHKHLVREGPIYHATPQLRSAITFKKHNLLADPFERQFDLIACRNVVIYFTDPAKDVLYRSFRDALRPGGILFIGGTERIVNHRELGFDCPMPFFYQRD